MVIAATGTTSIVTVTVSPGSPYTVYPIQLGVVDGDNILDDIEGTLTVFVQGAAPLEDVTFAIGEDPAYTDIGVLTADANGDVGPADLFIPDLGVSGDLTLRATSPTGGFDTITITIPGGAGGTGDPGVDSPPVLIAGSAGRWVMQDLMPGGIGSWVMPINPKSMSNPHVAKTVGVRHTTALNTGQYAVAENTPDVVGWTIAGYCPDEAYHDKLTSYAELNRRIYVIDHRGRAWKCAVTGLEITPRKRQIENDGTAQDWAADYRMTFTITEPEFLTPA